MLWTAQMEVADLETTAAIRTSTLGSTPLADQLLGLIRNELLDVIVDALEDGRESMLLSVEIVIEASREAVLTPSLDKPPSSASPPPTTKKSSARTRRSGNS